MDNFQLTFYFILLLLLYLLLMLQAAESQSICGEEVCGNITIRSPFGIDRSCYRHDSFRVTCNGTLSGGQKPFININGMDVEVLGSVTLYMILINNPVTYVNCEHRSRASSLNLTGTPFYFPVSAFNYFGSVGCGNLATIFSNEADSLGGCLQPICGDDDDGGTESRCFINIAGNYTVTSYTVNMTTAAMNPGTGIDDSKKRCASAFMFYPDYSRRGYPFPGSINIDTEYVPAGIMWDPNFCGGAGCEAPGPGSINIQSEKLCGEVGFQYPFGISNQDYPTDWFGVMCKEMSDGRRMPFLKINGIDLQVLGFSFSDGAIWVNHSTTYFKCSNIQSHNNGMSLNLTGSPFYYSDTKNKFWSSGCGNFVTAFSSKTGNPIGGCLQPSCLVYNATSSVAGCRINIPQGLTSFYVNMSGSSTSSCGFASMVNWDSTGMLDDFDRSRTHVPTVLQWGTPINGLCQLNQGSNTSCNDDPNNQYCWSWFGSRHLCVCSRDYDSDYSAACHGGNCGMYRICQILCLNSPGNYCSTRSCPPKYEYNSTGFRCDRKLTSQEHPGKNWRLTIIIIGCSTSIGSIFLLLAIWQMHKVLKRRKNTILKQKYFKRNGGLLLQQHLSSIKGHVEKIKLFTSKEMERATDYYNENRVLGQGGQGTVYKGMLTDGSIVAIKKSKMEKVKRFDERKVEQFINEVIILSRINHRNVVSLLGCCLEAEIPLLVYEFIPNGTLYELIHHQSQEFPLTWDMRMRIAIEIANALFYLHSAASVPIYHRDIKTSNILLDVKYRAKVSDFGTSRSVASEQTHLTTRVQGTFGYMDPEYFRSSQFTEKSDVYSFGVVLVELLTGQKPVCSNQTEEVRSLVSCFLLSMEENSLFDILDSMVVNHGPEKQVMAMAKLAKRCLNLVGKKRPTMKQVAMELELIKTSEEANAIDEDESDGEESEADEIIESWGGSPCCSSTGSIKTDSVTLPLKASF